MYTVRVVFVDGHIQTYKKVNTLEYSQKFGMLFLKSEASVESLHIDEFESFKVII